MIPNFSDLKYFIVIAETQNLSRASERLGVVQPTLSQTLKRLESSLKTTLVIRKKNGIELTRSGSILYRQATDLINAWSQVGQEISNTQNTPRGKFIIGAHASVALYSYHKFLPGLMEKYQELSFELRYGLSREILENIVSSQIDFGLIINPRRHLDLVIKRLAVDRVGLWQSSNKTIDDVLIGDPSLNQTQSLLKKEKRTFNRYIYSQNLEVVGELTAVGCGIGILPERVAQRYQLVPVKGSAWYQDELTLCYRKDRQSTPAAQIIIEAIKGAAI